MSELKVFENSEFGQIRTAMVGNTPYFVGKDVAEILGYANTKDALATHVDEDDKVIIQRSENATFDIPNRGLTVINESGLYSLVLSSKLPSAKRFKKWVTSEVLPAIRKHGLYAVDDLINDPDLAIKALTALKEERERNKTLKQDNDRMRPKEIFADAVASSHTSILVGDLAKLLNQNGVDIGQKRFFAWLRDKGYLIRRNGQDWNMPTQRSMELGLFEVKESTVNQPDGSVRINRTTKVTGKGQQYFINKFLNGMAEA